MNTTTNVGPLSTIRKRPFQRGTWGSRWVRVRRLTLTVSVLFGMICFGMPVTRGQAVVNPSFEILEAVGGDFPNSFGDWNGDISEIVTQQNGVVPADGVRMLKYFATSTAGPTITRSAASMYQLVDLSPLAAEIATGQVVAETSVLFNRVAGDAETDTLFSHGVAAFDGNPSDFISKADAEQWLASQRMELITDADVGTWEVISLSLLLPPGTEYLSLGLSAIENVFNDGAAPELDGHYADDVTLSFRIVPEPSTAMLLVVALLVTAARPVGVRGRRLG